MLLNYQQAYDRGILLDEDKEHLQKKIAHLRKVNSVFYSGAVQGEIHAFIEFCGLQAKFIDIAQKMIDSGMDPRSSNIHTRNALPVEEHDIDYLAEKFECIFGAAFEQNPKLAQLFCKRVFGRNLQEK